MLMMITIFDKNMVAVPIHAAGSIWKNAWKTGTNMYKWRDSFEHPSNSILFKGRGHNTPLEPKSRIFQRGEYHNRVKCDEKQGNQNMQWIDYNFECLLTYIIIIDWFIQQIWQPNSKTKVNMTLQATRTWKNKSIKGRPSKNLRHRKGTNKSME